QHGDNRSAELAYVFQMARAIEVALAHWANIRFDYMT
ncbi:hypothetical protein IG631_24251, partial [Alternaria alternata]